MLIKAFQILLTAFWCTTGFCAMVDTTNISLPVVSIPLGGEYIAVEVATSDSELQHGLQGRQKLSNNAGMLLVLPSKALRCAWMKDTYIPLTAAFLDDAGYILKLSNMAPLSLNYHCSSPNARYILEMNLDWYRYHKIVVGDRVDLKSLFQNEP